MSEALKRKRDDGAWRRFVDFPLVALVIAIGLFVFADRVGTALGSAIHVGPPGVYIWTRNAVILVAMLAIYKLAIRRLGEAPHDDLPAKGALTKLGIGILVGFLLMTASVAVAALLGIYHPLGQGDGSQLTHALIAGAVMPAFVEELLFRGILFRWIEQFAGSWVALLLNALLFGGVHILNPGATWFSSLAIATEAGLLLGGAYMLTRSLWLPIGLHAAWNFTQGEIFDVPVSGLPEHGLLLAKLSGPAILSGGPFGLEASVITLILATASGLWFVRRAVRKGEVVKPWWERPPS